LGYARRAHLKPTSPLDHAGVFVDDLERARAFYERTLGMSFIENDEDDHVWMATLRSGAQEVHLFKSKTEAVRPHLNHLAFRVSKGDLAARLSALREEGIAFTGPHRYNNTSFSEFKDPDGLSSELIAVDEAATER